MPIFLWSVPTSIFALLTDPQQQTQNQIQRLGASASPHSCNATLTPTGETTGRIRRELPNFLKGNE
jgi:hypothetical protein